MGIESESCENCFCHGLYPDQCKEGPADWCENWEPMLCNVCIGLGLVFDFEEKAHVTCEFCNGLGVRIGDE